MNKKVFISYSHQDKSFVEWLIHRFSQVNIDVWYDNSELRLGDSIKDKITKGISSSSIFIIVLSENSNSSNWVRYELNSALLFNAIKNDIRIIPIKIDKSPVPADLSGYLYADFSKNKEAGFQLLQRTLIESKASKYSFNNWDSFDRKSFEDLVHDLLVIEGFDVLRTPKTRDGGFDFIVNSENLFNMQDSIIVEAKFYKNRKISVDLLYSLYGVSIYKNINKVLLVTNSELTNASREFVKKSFSSLIVWEGHELIEKLLSHEDLLTKYLPNQKPKSKKVVNLIDDELIKIQSFMKRLDKCPKGKEGWKQYEDICVEILDHLFVPPLGKPKIQSRRESGIDIRDAIYPNRNKNENWLFIRNDYDAKYIVFEFKNYSDNGSEINKQTVLQIDDYLKKTIGRFGIILSRKSPNSSGLEKRKDVFVEHNKLILFINNDDLKEMMLRKHKNLDPSDVIIELIDDFNLKF